MNDEKDSITIYDGTFDLSEIPRYPTTKGEKDLINMVYEGVFEAALDSIAAGISVSSIIRNDPRSLDYARFLRWVRRDRLRLAKYEEAQEIYAEMIGSELVAISDGEARQGEMPTTAERDRIKIETRKWLMEKFNKKRFGQSKQLDVSALDDGEAVKNMTIDELERIVSSEEKDALD